MIVLINRAAISGALSNLQLDVDLRALIGRRVWQLYVEQNQPRRDDVKIVVVEGGDTPNTINQAVGFAITGPDAEHPSYERLDDLGLWFEIAYRREGLNLFIFVENNPGTELVLHYMCLAHFWPD